MIFSNIFFYYSIFFYLGALIAFICNGKYYGKVKKYSQLQNDISEYILDATNKFKKVKNIYPKKIIIYREGDIQNDLYAETENLN